ncbi:MAG: 16S rRNA (cytidine(1402)-2'-O)-methyltransferase [Alphaproteobacteria bacterium]
MLYLVPTPIGNLDDITLRGLDVLKRADLIAAEDTRHTAKLLNHYAIKTPQQSYHEHNEQAVTPKLIERLQAGETIAVVTDAGTPGISDPGYRIMRAAIDAGVEATVLPGASAVVPAIVLSGLQVSSFTFRGFLARKSGRRKNEMLADQDSPHTLVFYEAPSRVHEFLRDALAVYGDRDVAVVNDISKMYEAAWRGQISKVLEDLPSEDQRLKGEFAIVLAGSGEKARVRGQQDVNAKPKRVRRHLRDKQDQEAD